MTLYIFGEVAALDRSDKRTLACRVHDECNGSDVFGSDICTCRPYLVHGIEECVKEAQKGGVGLIVYNRKEGRALGEVTKFLVYNARKRQEGGDQAATYFERTECVAGVQDARFQQLMPDVLHWLGIRRIDRLMSMSNMKYDAIVGVRHRGRRARADPAGARPAGCRRRDRGEEGGGLLHAGRRPRRRRVWPGSRDGIWSGSDARAPARSYPGPLPRCTFSVKVSAVAVSITTPPAASAQPNGSCA